jgi:hypothetical protein
MPDRAKVPTKRIDHVDRRSQVGVSGALRARDVSRPDDALVEEVKQEDDPDPAPEIPAWEAHRPPRID